MNKKIIAIAIATAMAAPVAMADLKVSGRVGGHLTAYSHDDSTKDRTGFDDAGQTRLQFDGTAGNAYARIALDERLSRSSHTHTTTVAGDDTGSTNTHGKEKRDNYAGYKFGGGMSAQFGRMGGAAKNIEKDPLIGTFLQTRGTEAESITGGAFGSSSFVDHLIQAKFKAGAATITVQLDAGDESTYSPNEGHTALAVTGKGGPVRYWASYNNGTADGPGATAPNADANQSNMKVGGEMKFGAAKVNLNYTASDDDGTEKSSIAVNGNIGMGNGLAVHVGYAIQDNNDVDGTWMRLAVTKKLNKGASVYAGYTASTSDTADKDNSELGAGMTVKF